VINSKIGVRYQEIQYVIIRINNVTIYYLHYKHQAYNIDVVVTDLIVQQAHAQVIQNSFI